jgi:hypothetical protein
MSDSVSSVENGARSPGPSDPASSLRAAALLTLKAKRRKPVVDTSGSASLSQRPPPTDSSLQLDYGQEDISSSPTDVATPTLPLKTSSDVEDGQVREEGEISDSEDAPSKPLPNPASDPPATVVKVESPTHNVLDRIHPGPSPPPVSLGEYIIDADHVRPGLTSASFALSF